MLTPKSPSKQCGEKINIDDHQRQNCPRTNSHALSLKISENTLLKKKIHQAREEVYCLFALGWKLIDGKCVVRLSRRARRRVKREEKRRRRRTVSPPTINMDGHALKSPKLVKAGLL